MRRGAPANGRWLALDTVLGKFKSRMRDLRAGKSPEELNLGNSLPVDACIGLLQFLHGAVQARQRPPPTMPRPRCDWRPRSNASTSCMAAKPIAARKNRRHW